jgi:hypothetical protein
MRRMPDMSPIVEMGGTKTTWRTLSNTGAFRKARGNAACNWVPTSRHNARPCAVTTVRHHTLTYPIIFQIK